MIYPNLAQRVIIGIKKQPLKLLTSIFLAYAAIWTILEPIIGIVPNAAQSFSGDVKFFTLIVISLCIGFYRNAVPNSINIKHGNYSIVILFGDLFSCNGFKVIPVSRYFFETQVVPTSLQSKIIQMFVQSREGDKGFSLYNQSLSSALQSTAYEERHRGATNQKERYYPLGATAVLELDGNNYMMFALTETELKGYIPKDNCNVSRMWIALENFWREARINARGKVINIPLIGSGVTGIKLNPSRLLEVNFLALVNELEEGGKITTEEVRIVLHPKYIEDINLSDFQSIWSSGF
ncbi:MAG: hypothetical protein F6K41_21900 [Symploca sp. SIO3E6]|nr:hypothetical protein [Caldora sp. SIO3E6]